LEALTNYDWPGNIRELQNVIERSVVLSNGPEIHAALPEIIGRSAPIVLHGSASNVTELSERARILQVLKKTKGMVGGTNGAAGRRPVRSKKAVLPGRASSEDKKPYQHRAADVMKLVLIEVFHQLFSMFITTS
jgi:DNA-binding NtrC family response regulator